MGKRWGRGGVHGLYLAKGMKLFQSKPSIWRMCERSLSMLVASSPLSLVKSCSLMETGRRK
jgi:hypothetical protein